VLVVFDSNIFVSALITPKSQARQVVAHVLVTIIARGAEGRAITQTSSTKARFGIRYPL
jgi:predicted nucleic acid-binding protein